jgi:hypothetical protein
MAAERPPASAVPRNRTGALGDGVGAGVGIGVGDGLGVGVAVGDGGKLMLGRGLGVGISVSAHATTNAAGVSAPSWRMRRREIRAGSGPPIP